MTLIEERTLRMQTEGYWAVEVRLGDADAVRPMYLCHAASDREAGRMAAHLMGSTNAVRGFNYYRLETPIGDRPADSLPALGAHQAVTADAWPALMLAHAASEAAYHDHLSRAAPTKENA